MPRLLLLCEYPTLHGGERSMLATLGGVRAAGFGVTVAAPPEGPLAEALRREEVEVVPFRTLDGRGRRIPRNRLRADLAEVIARRRPDLFHANSLSMGRLSGPVAADLGVPSLAHLRDVLRLGPGALADLNRHTRLLAVSRATRDWHVAAGLDPAKTHVLYNGVDLARFRPRPASGCLHRELGLPPGTVLAATIGQISLRKGQDVLVQSAAMLAGALPQWHFLIVGERHSGKAESRRFEADLRAAAESGPLAGRLHLLGTRDDVDQLLNELALLIHPARQEPLGRVLLEAAASGAPIVATDVGGTREIFPPETHSAMLVPAGGPESLAAAVREAASDDALRVRLAAAAHGRAAAFDIQRATAALLAHYHDLL